MPTRTATREEFLSDIIICAIEGGTGYWAQVIRYKHTDLPPAEIHAVIFEEDDEGAALEFSNTYLAKHGKRPSAADVVAAGKAYRIDIEVIARGIAKVKEKDFGVNGSILSAILTSDRDNDAGDIDADAADVIVQAALFGKLVYG
jgi:hypothetical protein